MSEGAHPATSISAEDTGSRVAPWMRAVLMTCAALLVWLAVVHGVGSFSTGDAYTDRVGHALRAVCTALLVVPLVVLARRHLDRRPWAGLRLTNLREGLPWLLRGMLIWLTGALLGLAVTLGLGWATVGVGQLAPATLLLAVYLPVLVFLYEALPEELVFRGYVYRNLADRYPPWAAVVGQAVLFTLWGVALGAAQTVDRVVLFATFALVLGILRAVSGNLWACIGFHLAFQFVTQFDAAASRQGAVVVAGRPELEFVAYWFFPIVVGALALTGWAWARGRRSSRLGSSA